MEEEKWDDVEDAVESKSTSKDALTIAGAVLLGCLIISGTLAYVSARGVKVTGQMSPSAATDQAAEQPAEVQVTLDQIKALFTDKNIMFGKKDSKVLFVEFSDPSCPWCHVAAGKNSEIISQKFGADAGSYVPMIPEMKKLVDSGKAGFVWLYNNGHGNGELATKALYCAKEKGKFWEVHDLLMSAAGYDLMNNKVKNDVSKAGDMADFLKSAVKKNEMQTCLTSGKYDNRLTSDMALAQQLGANGTPGIFVNTTKLPGAVSYTSIASMVDEELKK